MQFDNGNHPDYCLIEPEDNGIKIKQIREMQSKIAVKPIQAEKNVYVIDQSETMNVEAQNCLLKTLEEPPEYAVIILICSNENMLLSTVKSRCTKIKFNDISKDELLKFTDEELIELADGSIGKALKLGEKKDTYIIIKQILENIEKYDKIDFVKNAEVLYKSKDDIFEILDFVNVILFNKAKQNEKYVNCISFVNRAKNKLKQNSNFDMTIDEMCFSIWEEINENYNRG